MGNNQKKDKKKKTSNYTGCNTYQSRLLTAGKKIKKK